MMITDHWTIEQRRRLLHPVHRRRWIFNSFLPTRTRCTHHSCEIQWRAHPWLTVSRESGQRRGWCGHRIRLRSRPQRRCHRQTHLRACEHLRRWCRLTVNNARWPIESCHGLLRSWDGLQSSIYTIAPRRPLHVNQIQSNPHNRVTIQN